MVYSHITAWQIEGETVEAVTDFIFLGSRITADGDCSHEIKRCLLLERKSMTNLDSILKSSNVTLPTKTHICKAFIFPVVRYGCESWTRKKTEHRRINAFKSSILKEINPECSLEGLMLKIWYIGHLMCRVDSLEKTLMLGKIEHRR